MHYLFKLAVKNIFVEPKSIQYKHRDAEILVSNDTDETLLESLYTKRIDSDELFAHRGSKKKDGGK